MVVGFRPLANSLSSKLDKYVFRSASGFAGRTNFTISGRNSAFAFTLTELLVTVAIVVVLIALLTPSVDAIMTNAKRTKCASNLRQIGQMAMLYANENDGNLPMTFGTNLGKNNSVAPGIIDLLGPYLQGGERIFYCPDALVKYEVSAAPGPSQFHETGYYWTLSNWFPFNFPASVPQKVSGLSPVKGVLAMCLHFSGYPVHANKMNVLFADGHTEVRKGNPQGVLLPYVDPTSFQLTQRF